MKPVIKSGFIGVIILMLFGFCPSLSSLAMASNKDSFYHIELSKEVFDKPGAMVAWRAYGKFKSDWRDSIFF